MFSDEFSWKFRGDDVFYKTEQLYGFYIDFMRSKCCYFISFRYVFRISYVFTGAFSIDFFEHFNGKNTCIGGAPEVKTVEILMKNR